MAESWQPEKTSQQLRKKLREKFDKPAFFVLYIHPVWFFSH
jgi:hypothetical protein